MTQPVTQEKIKRTTQRLTEMFEEGFRSMMGADDVFEKRIGVELKFPLVTLSGEAPPEDAVKALWGHLDRNGWTPDRDTMSGDVIGAHKAGEKNDTVASCETGYCKPEFSLAHSADLFGLQEQVRDLRATLKPYCEEAGVRFLTYGIQPVSPPGRDLMMKKARTSFWHHACPSNRRIPEEEGDDVQLFTVNAGSHVHIGAPRTEAMQLVNVLNGFAPAQLALTAHSNVWRGARDEHYKCVNEKLWDWWEPARNRCGVPARPFRDVADYVEMVTAFRPIYVKRDGQPIILSDYDSFREYYATERAAGRDINGNEVELEPEAKDIDLHNSCYWFNARISRYYTVENRTCDQQPVDALLSIAAITLGLSEVLDQAWEVLRGCDWAALRKARETACRHGLAGETDGLVLAELCQKMLDLCHEGLRRRGRNEEAFLEPLRERLGSRRCPADDVADLFADGGVSALIENRAL